MSDGTHKADVSERAAEFLAFADWSDATDNSDLGRLAAELEEEVKACPGFTRIMIYRALVSVRYQAHRAAIAREGSQP